MTVFELIRELISIVSTSGDEGQIAQFLSEYLSQKGFDVDLQDIGGNRPNVYARRGQPEVVLSTHTDTVPPYFGFSEDHDFIYGRGACDAKGIVAAMIKAAEALVESRVDDFGLLFVVGEEAGSPGALAANDIPNQSRYLINGEPTESKLALGSKGALRAILRTHGRAAHSAYPEMGESAIDKLLEVLTDLKAVEWPTDERLGATTMNIGVIKGGVAANVIPAGAEAELMLRVVTRAASVKKLLEEVAGSRAEIEYRFECEPIFTMSLKGFKTAAVSFTTDIPLLSNWGTPLLFGPGSILDAHTAAEKISKRELEESVLTYQRMVRMLKT